MAGSFFIPGLGPAKVALTIGKTTLNGVKIFGKGKNNYFTHEARRQVDEVFVGQMGRFKNLKGEVGDDLTAHHMPSAGILKAKGYKDTDNAFTMVLTQKQHEGTRTYGGYNRPLIRNEINDDLNDILMRDLDNLVSNKVLDDPMAKAAYINMLKSEPNPPSWFDPSRF